VGAAVALFGPLWAGPETLAGLRMLGQTGLTGSTASVITAAVSQVAGNGVARPLVAALAGIVLAGAIGVSAWWATDGRRLLDACAAVSVTYLLVASPGYYPWYVVLPVSLLSAAARGSGLVLMLVLSVGSRLVAPLDLLYVQGIVDRRAYLLATWVLAIAMPAAVIIRGAVLRRRQSTRRPRTG
ncbi:MAG: hypothetical protein H0V12_10495, partial [Chloroflexi bacterium]|nr:hypothetical protein [Chloroflexota bacterium]